MKSYRIFDLKCEYLKSPNAICEAAPRFSFKIGSKGTEKYKLRLSIAKSEADLNCGNYIYDTDYAELDAPFILSAPKGILKPFSSYVWQIFLKSSGGEEAFSKIQSFETGVFSLADWQASWISAKGSEGPVHLRKSFAIDSLDEIKRIKLYAASTVGAFGALTFFVNQAYHSLNGKRVGEDEIFPGQISEKKRRALYLSFDVSDLICEGENAFGAVLLSDAYSAFLAIEYNNGNLGFISLTDGAKLNGKGAYTLWDIGVEDQAGKREDYDSTREFFGFDTPRFDDKEWSAPTFTDAPKIIREQTARAKVIEAIAPISVTKVGGTHFLLDFGKVIHGHIYLPMKKAKRGRRVSIAYAENILPNGELDPLSTINFQRGENGAQIDTYVTRGDEKEIYEPRFANHSFRYAMIMNYPTVFWSEELPEEIFDVRAMHIHSPVLKESEFKSSDEDINKLYSIATLSERDNLVTIPMDCPARERHGWLGDAWVIAEAECIQFDMLTFYESWLRSICDDQNESGNLQYITPNLSERIIGQIDVPWCFAAVAIPYFCYEEYGDEKILEKSFPMMERWAEFLETLKGEDGYLKGAVKWGDHTAQEEMSFDALGAIYYCLNLRYISKIARILGKDYKKYDDAQEKTHGVLKKRLYECEGFGGGRQGDLSHAFALDLIDESDKEKFLSLLISDIEKNGYKMTCGALGIYHLISVLSEFAYHDVIYKICKQKDEGSFLYWVDKYDATTSFESLHYTPWNSRNHPFLMGSVHKWFYEGLAGIKKTAPAYKRFTVKPYLIGEISSVSAKIETPCGLITLDAKRCGSQINYEISVPHSCEAKLVFENGDSAILGEGTHAINA